MIHGVDAVQATRCYSPCRSTVADTRNEFLLPQERYVGFIGGPTLHRAIHSSILSVRLNVARTSPTPFDEALRRLVNTPPKHRTAKKPKPKPPADKAGKKDAPDR